MNKIEIADFLDECIEKYTKTFSNFVNQPLRLTNPEPALSPLSGLTNLELALVDLEEMIDYTSVELADEILQTKNVFENKNAYSQLYQSYKIDGVTYFLNIGNLLSIVELSALLRRADLLTTVTQNVYRKGEFDLRMSYRKISLNRWGVVHESSSIGSD